MIIVRNKRTFNKPGVYVGRPSTLRNRWEMNEKDPKYTREKVIGYYREWLHVEMSKKDGQVYKLIMEIVELAKRQDVVNLICWCAPLACHADVIKECVESIIATGSWGG